MPLGLDEGEVYVYLGDPSAAGPRWTVTVSSVAAIGADGTRVPLDLAPSRRGEPARQNDRLIASGRVPAQGFAALEIQLSSVKLHEGGRASDLSVPSGPLTVRTPFSVASRQASVLRVALRAASATESFEFDGTFDLLVPERPAPSSVAYCSHADAHQVSLIDKLEKTVVAVAPTGAGPSGLALDGRRSQAFVALAGEDEVLVLDSATAMPSGRVELSPRDLPEDLALTPDGRTLLVLNREADAVSFVDAQSRIETGRITVREDPVKLLLDRPGARAYVFTSRPPAVAVIDVASRGVAGVLPLDADPIWGDLDRAGRRLYVVHRGSPYVSIVTLPGLAISGRIFVGGGATVAKVDPRTDLVYVARRDSPVVDVFDPLSLLAIDSLRLPAPATSLAIDDAENTLWALAGDEALVAIVDLTTRALVASFDLPGRGTDFAMVRER